MPIRLKPVRACAAALVLMLGSAACARVYTRTETFNETKLHGDYGVASLQQGGYFYVRTGLMASASAEPRDDEGTARLGARAMDGLVKAARLRRNQALVNVSFERGLATLGSARLVLVTARGDVIEFFSNNPNPPLAPEPPAAPTEDPPVKQKVRR